LDADTALLLLPGILEVGGGHTTIEYIKYSSLRMMQKRGDLIELVSNEEVYNFIQR
jgi:hypothetical protein